MTTEWYLHSLDEGSELNGLSRRTFVVGPPRPVQAVRQHFYTETVRCFDLLQFRVLQTMLLEPPISIFSLFNRSSLTSFPLVLSTAVFLLQA